MRWYLTLIYKCNRNINLWLYNCRYIWTFSWILRKAMHNMPKFLLSNKLKLFKNKSNWLLNSSFNSKASRNNLISFWLIINLNCRLVRFLWNWYPRMYSLEMPVLFNSTSFSWCRYIEARNKWIRISICNNFTTKCIKWVKIWRQLYVVLNGWFRT